MKPKTQARPTLVPLDAGWRWVRSHPAPILWGIGMAAWVARGSGGRPDAWPFWEAGFSFAALVWFQRSFEPRHPWAALFPVVWWGTSAAGLTFWAPSRPGWVLLCLGLVLSSFAFRLRDGKWALACMVPFWAGASVAWPMAWVAALFGALFPFPVTRHRAWFRWGALGTASALGILAWIRGASFHPLDLLAFTIDFLWGRGGLALALLAWLGAALGRSRGWGAAWFAQLCGWILAWAWMGFEGPTGLGPELPVLLLIAAAGWGLQVLRSELMDPGWTATVFGWALGISVAVAFFYP